MQMNFPTRPTQGPIRGVPATRGRCFGLIFRSLRQRLRLQILTRYIAKHPIKIAKRIISIDDPRLLFTRVSITNKFHSSPFSRVPTSSALQRFALPSIANAAILQCLATFRVPTTWTISTDNLSDSSTPTINPREGKSSGCLESFCGTRYNAHLRRSGTDGGNADKKDAKFKVPLALLCLALAGVGQALAQGGLTPAPNRTPKDGGGPYDRLVIRGITVIDGTGAAPVGPMDVVVEHDRITDVVSVGEPHVPIKEKGRPAKGTREIDGTGMYLMPGFVDTHVHYGDAKKAPDAEYVNKLWLASGVTTVRGVPAGPLDWALRERERSAKNEITAPHIYVYQPTFTGDGWKPEAVLTPELGREWVRFVAGKGVDGVKFFGGDPDVVAAILDEAKKYKLGSLAHLGQESEPRLTARDATRLGLRTVTHSYGLFESLLKDTTVQDYPTDQNYNDEQMRFGQVARNWNKIYPRGSEQWNALIAEWVKGGTVLNPTMVIYSAGRDLERAYTAEWHDKYTLPSLMQYYQPNRENHGSY